VVDVFRQLLEDGITECNQLASEMRTSPATISRMAKKGFDEGWLKKKGTRVLYFIESAQEDHSNRRYQHKSS
jgi:predicted transcriptional regulator